MFEGNKKFRKKKKKQNPLIWEWWNILDQSGILLIFLNWDTSLESVRQKNASACNTITSYESCISSCWCFVCCASWIIFLMVLLLFLLMYSNHRLPIFPKLITYSFQSLVLRSSLIFHGSAGITQELHRLIPACALAIWGNQGAALGLKNMIIDLDGLFWSELETFVSCSRISC